MLKILHTGDLHLDSPLSSLDFSAAEKARDEHRNVFAKMMRYAIQNEIDMILFAGDVFDSKYVTTCTKELFISLLGEFKKPVIISPGNHDPLSSLPLYKSNLLPENVFVFSSEELQRFDFDELDVSVFGDHVDLGLTSVESKALAKNLKNCRRAVIFGATVGMEIDRRIARYSAVSPVKALVFQAIGAERIEALCDVFCQSIKNDLSDGEKLCPRFSPGYGDLSIEFQREIFSLLGCERRIGLTLNESLVMSPSKSVTAIVGIK